MHTRKFTRRLGVIAGCWLVASFGLAGGLHAIETPDDAYHKAVAAYVEAAANQVNAIRAQVDAESRNGSEATRKRYADVYDRLTQCDKLIAQLRSADTSDFDPRKKDFETTLHEAIAALEAARKAAGS
ncbi:MAG TPA: hypothetical protein VL200_04005 [Lacunisphaera sp.]|jgi:hypothetical protein|nr:hypothetical protein [Lacunisphaera sp.]